jgi:2-succinyl-5-enolpyruvyl-6-hydroxy-3-cyclohexene-1-carboxylate synthase
LPLISSEEDEWVCNRLVNEAILSLTHHGTGPVQINIPIVGRTDLYDEKEIPKERKVDIVDLLSEKKEWGELAKKIKAANRILVVVGQNVIFSNKEITLLEKLYKKSNCIFSVEHLSNLSCVGCVNTYPISEVRGGDVLSKFIPDLVISFGNNLSAYVLKPFLRLHYRTIENWLVSESGEFRDAYKSLSTIIEMPIAEFLSRLLEYLPDEHPRSGEYYAAWQHELQTFKIPDFQFSNMYVASRLAKIIPANSILHLAILNSTRIMQFFNIAENVRTYSNVGALGIDGCLSTFAGQASASDELAYLLIGDLSFFYDMNAAGLRNIGSNVRIILLNNCGGSEFHFFIGKDRISTINDYISAEHGKVAAGWAISLGYDYYCASTKEELDEVITKFGQKSDRPMFLEVITDMEEDARITKEFYASNVQMSTKAVLKNAVRKVLSEECIEQLKKVLGKVR